MIIYIDHITPRIQYIFDFVFSDILGVEYRIYTDLTLFNNVNSIQKWSYGVYIPEIPSLPMHDMMLQDSIIPQDVKKIVNGDITAIFEVKNTSFSIDFDLFASAFYLLSRYEEYLPSVHDAHGRFAAYQSVAVRFGFIDTAMVNRYIFWLIDWFRINKINLEYKKIQSSALFTFDIDHPFYKINVPFTTFVKRSIKDLFSDVAKDKFDTFDFISTEMEGKVHKFFVLCPKSTSKIDHWQEREHSSFIELIKRLADKTSIGIHPSYYSIEKQLVNEEILWLSNKLKKPIIASRWHFLRFTIDQLISAYSSTSIIEDYSMIYSQQSGFRSSTSFPYPLFDLKTNKRTHLTIFTPCIMDSFFEYYDTQDTEDHFVAKVAMYIKEINTYGGYFIPIFHNDILSKPIWQRILTKTKAMIDGFI